MLITQLSNKPLFCIFTVLFISISLPIQAQTTAALAKIPKQVAVASAAPQATAAGLTMLKKGGNAFDAAVAVASALAVVEPYSSGLGGGAFFLLHIADKQGDIDKPPTSANGEEVFIDARETAPDNVSSDMFLDKQGNPIKRASLDGALAAAIPGEVAGLVYLAEHYGKLPLTTSLKPAIKLASDGFKVDAYYRKMVRKRLQALRASPAAANVFLRKRAVPMIGTVIKQPALADTLRHIAHHGNNGFYRGVVAKKLIKGVQKAGGIWTKADLLDYRVVIRHPVYGHYRGMTIISAPPSSAGGIGLITALNILSSFDLQKLPSITRTQLTIETLRRLYLDRYQYLGDPAFISIPKRILLSQKHANKLRSDITMDKATPSDWLKQRMQEGTDTTHFSIIDNQGNWVAATLSLNYIFGSGLMPAGTGVLLNDHMDDFSIKSGAENVYGLVGSEANRIEPGKRPLSSMSPTFVVSDDKVAVLGTPGGSRIISMVLLAILDMAEGHLPTHWVARGRFHQQFLPDVVEYEKGIWGSHTLKRLKTMGYHLKPIEPYGNMQAILWDRKRNQLYAAADPRRVGSHKAEVISLKPTKK